MSYYLEQSYLSPNAIMPILTLNVDLVF